jgi:riboflavin synthase
MFTGIIEATGIVKEVITNEPNRSFWIESRISGEFQPDQSVSHDGVCLTVEEVGIGMHKVTAIPETLKKTCLSNWKEGTVVNLERCLRLEDRLDGHIVQGHVDCTATCLSVNKKKGSREFEFGFPRKFAALVIEKGSVCINGISLTAFDVKKKSFRVAIIPYTLEYTNVGNIKKRTVVNIEFDIIGKYLLRSLSLST